jgi:hypothetical protein
VALCQRLERGRKRREEEEKQCQEILERIYTETSYLYVFLHPSAPSAFVMTQTYTLGAQNVLIFLCPGHFGFEFGNFSLNIGHDAIVYLRKTKAKGYVCCIMEKEEKERFWWVFGGCLVDVVCVCGRRGHVFFSCGGRYEVREGAG